MASPDYKIWVRAINPESLYSRYDPTQYRGGDYRTRTFRNGTFVAPLTAAANRTKLSRGFIRVALVSNYEKLEFKTKYNNCGGWTLLMQDYTPEAEALKVQCLGNSGRRVEFFEQGGLGGITVIRNGKTIFGGPVRGFSATGDFYGENGPMVEFWGSDDTGLLETRLAMVNSPGNQLAPNGNPPYSGYNYSGRQISGSSAFDNCFVAPFLQGWGYYNYGSGPQNPAGERSVSTGLRNIVQLNIGVYAPYPWTYPYTYTNSTGNHRNDPPIVYNGSNFSERYTARRIPFLFMGVASSPQEAYTNNSDSDGLQNPPGVPNFQMRARYQTLLSKCQEIASYTVRPINPFNLPVYRGYQFSIDQDDILVSEVGGPNPSQDNIVSISGLRFNYRQPRRNETSVIFSESLGNLGSYKYEFTQPEATEVTCAGQGEATLRWFTTGRQLHNDYQYGLKEKFADRRDVQFGDEGPPNTLPSVTLVPNSAGAPNPAPAPPVGSPPDINYDNMKNELDDAVDVVLREDGPIINLEIEILESQTTRYFEDYFVGDWVTVRLGASDIPGQITDVSVTLTRDEGEVIKGTVGTQAVGTDFFVFDSINQNHTDVVRLETSQ